MSPPRRYSSRPFPPCPYVPGRGRRPERDHGGHWFGVRAAPETLDEEHWRLCEPYLFGIDLFNHGYWWEAHEALEALWIAAGRQSRIGRFLQGVIQVSVAALKHAIGANAPARRLAAAGCAKLETASHTFLGIDVAALIGQITRLVSGHAAEPPRIELVDFDG
ncbi:MAG: DUF309 domain-containing protein [Planctomycetota bacterium]|jgi:hypothetical protein